jgi:hypothetical protein
VLVSLFFDLHDVRARCVGMKQKNESSGFIRQMHNFYYYYYFFLLLQYISYSFLFFKNEFFLRQPLKKYIYIAS